jgi:CheY-like chemotaxis protein
MEEQTKNTGKKIMIVDDDNFLLDMYSMKFKASGYQVVVCSGSDEALSRLREGETPDIFVFDIVMPKMDGVALYETIKKENLIPDAFKVVLTNQGQIEDKEKADEMRVDGYIVKALHTPSEVVKIVEDIVTKK